MHLSPITPTSQAGLMPELLGRHRLLFHIGRGGMADVYLAAAIGPSGFHKEVVIKALRRELAESNDFLEMFMDEARLAARMRHPNVVQTLEVAREDGVHFMVLEYVEGQTLDRLVRRFDGQGLPAAVALYITREVLSALEYAHTLADTNGDPLGVVHRDVSPQNIMIGYEGRVRLLDFGVAKAKSHTSETRAGDFKGKIAYMAPEQAAGRVVDARTDLYAAGVVLWELIHGQRIWSGLPDAAVATRLLADELPMPDFKPSLPEPARKLIERAMAKDPEDRFASAAEFRLAVEGVLDALDARIDDRRLSELLRRHFGEEREALREALRTRLARVASGEMLPPNLLKGAVFGQPTVATDTALTVASRGRRPRESSVFTAAGRAAGFRMPAWVVLLLIGAVAASAVFVGRHVSSAEVAPVPPVAALGEGHGEAGGGAMGAGSLGASATRAGSASGEPRCDDPTRPIVELSGEIEEDATLRCNRRYLLRYNTFVRSGVTLRIEPGTLLLGDHETRGTLVVLPGGRLSAEGQRDQPIVFTSSRAPGERAPGDWGGVILMGRAPTNVRGADGQPLPGRVEGLEQHGVDIRYGGELPNDSSGVLRYVRIEYPGVAIAPNNEINGLTLAGVGSATVLDHVQVRWPLDDCFEFFGGTVDARYLICDAPGDDGFDWDQGYRGRLQFLLMRDDVRRPDASNGLEGDNDPNGQATSPRSAPVIFNATLCGGGGQGPGTSFGILARRATLGMLRNVLVSGFHVGLERHGEGTLLDAQALAVFGVSRARAGSGGEEGLVDVDDPIDCESGALHPASALRGGAEAPPTDGFFDTRADYLGAFRDAEDRWQEGWSLPLGAL